MKIADRDVENVVRAPVTGMILERMVNEGDPVVPLTSYQAGTELMLMADMDNLIFNGTVDEIDVGKLFEGMPATITIGALPNASIPGNIKTIAPKAKLENNATLFDVEINVNAVDSIVLRAGYSANANLIIEKKDSVLMIPERLITFAGDTAKVEVEESLGSVEDRVVELGISDGINIEVVSGLELDEKVVERPPKKIE
jgi:HlyD family secretion protein